MTNFKDYIAYFKGLANTYLANSDINKTFFRKGLDEFLNGLKDVNYPCMLIEKYDFKYVDNSSDDVKKRRTVAFMIVDHINDIEDYEAMDDAYDITEAIVDKIFNQIRYDRTNANQDSFVQYADVNNIEATPIEHTANGDYGYFVTVEIKSHHNTKI